MVGKRAVAGVRRHRWLGRVLLLLAGATAFLSVVLLVKPSEAHYRLGADATGGVSVDLECRAPLAAAVGLPSPRTGDDAFATANQVCQGAEERQFYGVLLAALGAGVLGIGAFRIRSTLAAIVLVPMHAPRGVAA